MTVAEILRALHRDKAGKALTTEEVDVLLESANEGELYEAYMLSWGTDPVEKERMKSRMTVLARK